LMNYFITSNESQAPLINYFILSDCSVMKGQWPLTPMNACNKVC
jgi:hypothetical protein